MIAKNGSHVDLGQWCVWSTRSKNMDHLNLTTAKESRKREFDLCVTSRKTFGNGYALTASMPKIYIHASVGHNNDYSTYKIYYYTNEKVIS